MDISIERKKKRFARRDVIFLVLAVLLFPVARYVWSISQAGFSIDRDRIVISEVRNGDFTVSVRGTGVLVPDEIQWLSAKVEATVTKVSVKAGNVVSEGDLVVELSNPELVQELAEAKWELQAQDAEANAERVAQELALLEQRAAVANNKMSYESSLLRRNAQAELLSTEAVSRLDYERTVLETAQFKRRWQIGQEQLAKMEQNLLKQSNGRKARLNKTKNIVATIQQQVDSLQVRATMDSVVLAMPLEAGQRVIPGDNIARFAEQHSLIAELQVPELQIRDVAVGQRVVVDTRNNKVEGRVARIDPAVIDGTVQVDVAFSEELPREARPDLSVDGEIIITEIPDTLYVDRPLFAQSRSQSAFYKVTENGRFGERVQVTVGYGSINEVEVVEGLNAGDQIITSDPTRFETYDKFRID